MCAPVAAAPHAIRRLVRYYSHPLRKVVAHGGRGQ